jgi:tetraacyldisaccharide 4'-kinase
LSNRAEYWRNVVSGRRGGIGPFFLRRLLWLARGPYSVGVWYRNRGYDHGKREIFRVPVPVISVGNLSVGGTGKTPCVEWIARFFREREVQVALLSRGYGSESGRNDEAMLLEENLPDVPHLQGRDRVELAKTAIEELESELLILDDGFQHRRLHRDLNLVLLDASEPASCHYLFPRGTLREPFTGLRRADAILLTHVDRATPEQIEALQQIISQFQPSSPVYRTCHEPLELHGCDGATESLESLRGRPVGAFCGIGNPESLRRTLEQLGAEIRDFRSYPDHHPYTREDVEALNRWAETLPPEALVLTTQKDWVKLRLPDLAQRPLWSVRIGLCFLDGQEQFEEQLSQVL